MAGQFARLFATSLRGCPDGVSSSEPRAEPFQWNCLNYFVHASLDGTLHALDPVYARRRSLTDGLMGCPDDLSRSVAA